MTCSKYGILEDGTNNMHTHPNPSHDELFEFIKDVLDTPLTKNPIDISISILTSEGRDITYSFGKREENAFYLNSISFGTPKEAT